MNLLIEDNTKMNNKIFKNNYETLIRQIILYFINFIAFLILFIYLLHLFFREKAKYHQYFLQ